MDEEPTEVGTGTSPTADSAAPQEDAEHPAGEGSGGAETRRRDSLRKEIRAGWQRALGH